MVAEPMCRVGGLVVAEPMCRLVKSDFISHSGSHQSTAWIQSRVWQQPICLRHNAFFRIDKILKENHKKHQLRDSCFWNFHDQS